MHNTPSAAAPALPEGSAIDLRSVDTEALQHELRARERCAKCGAQNARSWKTAGTNRVLCEECAPDHAVEVTS